MADLPDDREEPYVGQTVTDSTVFADSATGPANAFANFSGWFVSGDFYNGPPQPVKDVFDQIRNQDADEAALYFVRVPDRGTRVSALNMLDPGRAGRLLTSTARLTGVDQVSDHCARMEAANAATVLSELDPELAAMVLLRMNPERLAPRLRAFIAFNPTGAAAACAVLGGTDSAEPLEGPAVYGAYYVVHTLLAEIDDRTVSVALARLLPTPSTAQIVARMVDRRPRVVTALFLELPVECAAAFFADMWPDHAGAVLNLLNSWDTPRLAELLGTIRPPFAARLLANLSHESTGAAMAQMSAPRLAAVLGKLRATDAAAMLERLPPHSALPVALSIDAGKRTEVFRVLRPGFAHQLINAASAQAADNLSGTTPRTWRAALQTGRDADTTVALVTGPTWVNGAVAVVASLGPIARRLGYDRGHIGLFPALGAAYRSTKWMARAGAAATAPVDLSPEAAGRYRLHRVVLAVLLTVSLITILVLALTRPSPGTAHNQVAAHPSTSPIANPQTTPTRSTTAVESPLTQAGASVAPTAASKGTVNSALPVLASESAWQDACPAPTTLQPKIEFVLRLNCHVGKGRRKFTVDFVQYPVGKKDPFSGGRPTPANFTMLDGGTARTWTNSNDEHGTYLTY